MFETGVVFTSADYVQSLDYRQLLPTWRALKYIRKYDAATNTPGKLLELILPDNVFDDYKTQKNDIAYVAGAYIQINSSTQDQYYLLGCYLNPDITQTGYNSWIALDHPWCIIYDAAATVFKAIGKDEEAATYRALVLEQINELRISNVQAIGY
jgi:hypothetical protein